MKGSCIILLIGLLTPCFAAAGDPWKPVDDGFHFRIPKDWVKKNVRGIDSHVGEYRGKTAYLEFDEVGGLGYTNERAQTFADKLKEREANAKLLSSGEEIWHVNGRIADFSAGKVDPKIYGDREYPNVACLFVPYVGQAGYLQVLIFYKDDSDLPVVRGILKSIRWKS